MTQPFGSPLYMAPEVLKGCYNLKCDIWSAGVILHILLVGTVPFLSQNPREIFEKVNGISQIAFEDRAWKSRSIGSIELMKKIIEVDFKARLSASEAMDHAWCRTLGAYTVERSDIKACLISFNNFRKVGPL